jgi:ribosomal protein L11 methyltransferase
MVHDMKPETKNNRIDKHTVREKILGFIMTSTNRMTPPALEKQLVEKNGIGKKQVKDVIRELVGEGALAYTYEFGSNFLERSFNRSVRVSKHIVLQPPGLLQHRSEPNDVVVQIKPGASFGAGNHASTRLALRGIEHILLVEQLIDNLNDTSVLDIGTGSGVLLIAAILCGIKTGLGVDTDPCSVVEATENAKINGLVDRVAVSDQLLTEVQERFSIISANLRLPTLKNMRPQINDRTHATGYLVLSGIREHELRDLLRAYETIKFKKIWSEDELGWSAAVLQRNRKNIRSAI